MDAPRWLTVAEAAARLRVSAPTVRRLIAARKLAARPSGLGGARRHVRIDVASVAAYERATTQPALSVVTPRQQRQQPQPRSGDDAFEKLWGNRPLGGSR